MYAKDSEQADGQAVSTETVFIEDNMDKILEKLTALQRKIDWPGDQLWTLDQLQNWMQLFALTQTTICLSHAAPEQQILTWWQDCV